MTPQEDQRQLEQAAIAVAEAIKGAMLVVAERALGAIADQSPRFAAYALLEGSRAVTATLMRHALASDDDEERARAICAHAVASLEAIITPPRQVH